MFSMGLICISDILGVLSDDKTLALFKMLALTLSKNTDVMEWLGLCMLCRAYAYTRLNNIFVFN